MDPLSLTTLQKSFNMAVLFQPSIVLKPNPPSSFGLHWTSWSYGSYRWVRGLTKRNPECSMKWISISSPEAWKRTTNRCEGLQALRSASLSWQQPSFLFQLKIWRLNLSKRGRQSECLNLVDTRKKTSIWEGAAPHGSQEYEWFLVLLFFYWWPRMIGNIWLY